MQLFPFSTGSTYKTTIHVDACQSSLPRTLPEYSITLIDELATLSREHRLLSILDHARHHRRLSLLNFPLRESLSPIRLSLLSEGCETSIDNTGAGWTCLDLFTSGSPRVCPRPHNRTNEKFTARRETTHTLASMNRVSSRSSRAERKKGT